ncbi:hypothetical protein KUTeg_009812 [Tegillarca granosa]|uniref:DNA helicase n=1 Tax=Tegillarca granosa TaxID=220873 RepID=A0ABQ9F4Y2_TEGGR|nr:hypothetical protein KUTeg_009812 [Tegillarca granosa]
MSTGEFKRMINGVEIIFPCKPYPSQFSMMDKVIKGIVRRQNCLLESPTGSGKSLALLCSALAWQVAEYDKKEQEDKNENDSCCTCNMAKEEKLEKDGSVNNANNNNTIPVEDEKQEANSIITIPDDDDNDFRETGTKFRTPGTSGQLKNSKRKHQGISYESSPFENELDQSDKWNQSQGSLNDTQPEKCCACSCKESSSTSKIKIPKIYFGTRTHKQITQIVRELNKTAYREAKMTILASREHTCIHPAVSKMSSKPEGCKELLDGPGCKYNDRVKRCFPNQEQFRSHGLSQAWDIEDLVDLCKVKKVCAYFGSRSLRKDADIIFCPYNYLVDPVIREAMEIELKDQIIILDEAHNIEDSAREAASGSLKMDQLNVAIKELDEMVVHNIKTPEHLRLRQMCSGLAKIIQDNSDNLTQNDYDQSCSVWYGYDIIVRLKQEGVGPEHFDELKRCYIEINDDSEEDKRNIKESLGKEVKLHTSVNMTLKEIFKVLDYLYREDLKFVPDYRVAVLKSTVYKTNTETNGTWLASKKKRGGRAAVPTVECSLNFWCMNPGVAFSDFNKARNVILTSGTLSPMGSFQSELGVPFPIQLEANHVIQDKQVWVGAIGRGPNNGSLQAVYKTMESYNFQDELGTLVYNVCEKVPKGVLLFLPSYRALDRFRERWKATGLWDRIECKKKIFTEPRASEKVDFDGLLKRFYDAIEGNVDSEEDEDDTVDTSGALFIAVCRGKVSEGLDFADNNARAVITVGIPYPNFKDVQVKLKREYNDKHRAERGLLSGGDWYEIQAFRALNQALGRCIRHRKDWGALILVDERFVRNDKYTKGLSKWVRNKVQHFNNFNLSMDSLVTFTKERQIDMPVVDPETSFTPCTPVTPGMTRHSKLKESPVSSTPKNTENRQLVSPDFITPLKQPSTDHGGSFLNSPQTSATPSTSKKECTLMSPTEIKKNPKLQQATSSQQRVQAQPGVQNQLILLPPGNLNQVAVPSVQLNPVYQQILQTMNSPHVPKDKPYYVIVNEGLPNQQMFLIEPPQQPQNQPSVPTVAQPQIQKPVPLVAQDQVPVASVAELPNSPSTKTPDMGAIQADSKKQFVSLLSGKTCQQDSSKLNKENAKETEGNRPVGQPANTSDSHSVNTDDCETSSKNDSSGQLDTSGKMSSSLFKFCKLPNKETPTKSDTSAVTDTSSGSLNMAACGSPNLFDSESQKSTEIETDLKTENKTGRENQTDDGNNIHAKKKPIFKKGPAKIKLNADIQKNSLKELIDVSLSNSANTKMLGENKEDKNELGNIIDIDKLKILNEKSDEKNNLDDINKSATGCGTKVEEQDQMETGIEEEVLKTRRSGRGVKRKSLSRNKGNAKRTKGVDFLDGIDNTKENMVAVKKTKLICSLCGKIIVPQLDGGMAAVGNLKKKVTKNYKWIVKETILVELLDGMFSEGVFDQNDRELVLHEATTENKNRKFLDALLKKNKQKAYDIFFMELKEYKREDVVKRITETHIENEELTKACTEEFICILKYSRACGINPAWFLTSNVKLEES